MPAEEKRPDQAKTEKTETDNARSSRTDARSDCCDDWRCCEPPPYRDPYCGPYPYHGRHHHHHGRHHRWPMPPMPGSEFFEAMMQFAASTAGFRGRLWRGMADAARYARKDYMGGDPYYDPCAPYPPYCDPCAPPPSWCDPCPPPSSYCDPCDPRYCDPCDPRYGRRGRCEEPDCIDLRELGESLKAARDEKLKTLK